MENISCSFRTKIKITLNCDFSFFSDFTTIKLRI